MTNFLSKAFLCGIVLSSINGYCQDNALMEFNAGYTTGTGANAVPTAPAGISVENSSPTFTNDIIIGTLPTSSTYVEGKPAYIETAAGQTLTMGTYTTKDPNDNDKTITNGTTLTIKEHGEIKNGSTIVLDAKSKLILEKGSTVASSGNEANISGGTLDISGFITSSSNAPSFDTTNSAKICANLSTDGSDSDNVANVDIFSTYIPSTKTAADTKTLLDSFNNATMPGSTMFSGIKGTFTIVDTPYVIGSKVGNNTPSYNKEISTMTVSNIATNTTLSFNSLHADKVLSLFDNSSTITGKNAQDAFNSLYDHLNKDNAALGTSETTTKIIIDVDSFESCLPSANNTIDTTNRNGTANTMKRNIVLKRAEQSISLTNESNYTIDSNTSIADKYVLTNFADTTTKVTLNNISDTSTVEIESGNANTELAIGDSTANTTLTRAATSLKKLSLTKATVTISTTADNATLTLSNAPIIDTDSKLTISGIKMIF